MSHWLKIQNGCCITLMRPRSYHILIGWFPLCLNSIMVRTKVTPRKGRRGETKVLRTWAVVHPKSQPPRPPSPVHPPAQETPPDQEETQKRIAEAEWLEGWGGCHSHCWPDRWPRWLQRHGHLCQVGRSLPERSSIPLCGHSPQEEVLEGWKSQEDP